MVGTFYRAAKPGCRSLRAGGRQGAVRADLCIVEAMKLMNEIPSDADGEIAEIYVNNGEPVEYNQALSGFAERDEPWSGPGGGGRDAGLPTDRIGSPPVPPPA